MNTYRYDEEQRRRWVKDKMTKAKSVKQICQEAGISRATLYLWIDEFKHEDGIADRDQVVETAETTVSFTGIPARGTNLAARYRMLISAISKIDTDKTIAKKLVTELVKRFTLSVPQACEIVGIDEATYGYRPRKPEVDDQLVQDALLALLDEVPTRGFTECYELLIKQHPAWTRKQIKRVYRDKRLYKSRKRVRRAGMAEEAMPEMERVLVQQQSARLERPGAFWNLGIVEETIASGNVWVAFILDQEDGAPLNAIAGTGTPVPTDIVGLLVKAKEQNGSPRKMRISATEPFISPEVKKWAWDSKVALHMLSLNKPENLAEATETAAYVSGQLFGGTSSFEDLQQQVEGWLG